MRSADLIEQATLPLHGSVSFRAFQLHEVEQTIPDRFEQQVLRHPDRIALKSRDAVFAYGALNNLANAIAHAVVKIGGTAHDPIGMLFDHGPSFVAVSLALLKAGKVQVPLEASFPRARLKDVVHQSGLDTILTDSQHVDLARDLTVRRIVNIDDYDLTRPGPDFKLDLQPRDPVAIMYTSGSTGDPKGVVWTHRAVLHAVMRHTNTYRLCADDMMMGLRASPRPYLYALLNGAGYYPASLHDQGPEGLAECMERENITVFRAAASAFRAFARSLVAMHRFPHLRLVLLFGEAVHFTDVQLCRRSFGRHCTLAASLGCLEFDDYAWAVLDAGGESAERPLPGFQVMSGAEVLVVDGENQAVAAGEVGEIVLRSRHHPLGYWRRPDLTQTVFQPDRHDPTMSLYRTRDLGRIEADGRVFHAGRKDARVKVRGHLVAPPEVESALLQLTGIKEAAVVGRDAGDNDMRLVAYIVPQGPRAPDVTRLRRDLGEILPDYMIPSSFMLLDTLPLTPTGKIDRRALPLPDGTRPNLETPLVTPATPWEHRLRQLWEDMLEVRPIGTLDNFFDLGGHSLLAAQLAHTIEAATGRRLPLSAFFEAPTIRHLAKVLSQDVGGGSPPATVLNAGGTRLPFFFLHGDFEGGGLYCRNLTSALGPDQPLVAVHPHGLDGGPVPDTIEAMALEHLRTVRAIQPHGPYQLGGFCSGGLIAFEMARRLEALGEKVAFLGLLDVSGENSRFGSRVLRRLVNALGTIRGLAAEERLAQFASTREQILAWHRWACERAGYYRHRIPQLLRLGHGEWVVLLRRIATRTCVRMAGIFFRPKDGTTRDISPPRSSATDRFSRPHAAYRLAMAGYVPGRYQGPITIFRSQTYFGRPDLGWRAVASRIDVHDIPSDYSTMLTRHVQIVGERLHACLQNVNLRR